MPETFTMMDIFLTELDHRSADGIEIFLLWSRKMAYLGVKTLGAFSNCQRS